MADFSKILAHPNKDEIISKLMTGIKPKDVADWLKLKYPEKEQLHLRLSVSLLKEFTDSHGDMYAQMQQDVAKVKNGQVPAKKIAESLLNNKSYQERLNELADKEIDFKKKLRDIVLMIESRLEQYFDKMQENPENLRPDKMLIEWFRLLLEAADKANKVINEAPDMVVQHNVNVQTINQHTIFLQDAIRETMAEVDPQMAFLFMEKMNEKMMLLEEPQIIPMSLEKKTNEVKVLGAKVEKIMGDT